jgi:uracil-DNA glycosylase
MSPEGFIRALSELTLENTFNPYAERCPVHDVASAPQIRRHTLLAILKAASQVEIESIWIGRDLGYRGGRRTGLALTDDLHMCAHAARWSLSIERPTKGEAVAERTAAVIWDVLSVIDSHLFLWNVFPLHPHESGNPFSNRSHNSGERQMGEEILWQLISLLRPRRLVCIGNDAATAAGRLASTHDIIRVRHPSYGGQTEFLRQIRSLYRVGKRLPRTLL